MTKGIGSTPSPIPPQSNPVRPTSAPPVQPTQETRPTRDLREIMQKTQTRTTESTEVQDHIRTEAPDDMRLRVLSMQEKISLSDISGGLTRTSGKAQLKEVFRSLKQQFTLDTNKSTYHDDEHGSQLPRIKDLFLMRFNPMASRADKELSSLFDVFTYKEYSNEHTEFLKFSRDMVKLGVDHPDFDRHLATSIEHFVRAGSEREVNISYDERRELIGQYDTFLKNPSAENKASLLAKYSETVDTVYGIFKDPIGRFMDQGNQLKADMKEQKLGRLWNNFKQSRHILKNNHRPWNSRENIQHDIGNFFKSWGSFNQLALGLVSLGKLGHDGSDSKTIRFQGKNLEIHGTHSSQDHVLKAKTAMYESWEFNSGYSAPKYSDYGF